MPHKRGPLAELKRLERGLKRRCDRHGFNFQVKEDGTTTGAVDGANESTAADNVGHAEQAPAVGGADRRSRSRSNSCDYGGSSDEHPEHNDPRSSDRTSSGNGHERGPKQEQQAHDDRHACGGQATDVQVRGRQVQTMGGEVPRVRGRDIPRRQRSPVMGRRPRGDNHRWLDIRDLGRRRQ